MKHIKVLILAVICLLSFSTTTNAEFFSDIIVTSPNAVWTDSRAYANLNAAITAVGSNQRTVKIVSPQVVTTLTVPSNVTLEFDRDGSIANSGQLTINTKNIIAPNRQIFTGAGNIDFAPGSVLKSGWFNSIESAFALTVNDTVTLIVSKSQTITANYSPGTNVSLRWEAPGNILTISNGIALTISGPFEAGLYQVFSGSGTVAGLKSYRPEWYGAIANDSTDCTAAMNKAATAAGSSGTVLLSEGTYRVTATSPNYAVTFYGGVEGVSPKVSVIKNMGTGHAVKFIGDSDSSGTFYYSMIKNFAVEGNASSGNGISLNPDADTENVNRVPGYSYFKGVYSYNHGGHGLVHRYSWATRYEDCQFGNNGGLGVYLYEGVYSAHNNIIFLNCYSRWNGGTGNNSADLTKGGVRIAGAAEGVFWIGGAVESNNAWGFIIGDPSYGVCTNQVGIDKVYFEGSPDSSFASATGGFIYLSGYWNSVKVTDCKISYGASAGKTGYAFYAASNSIDSSGFKESNNTFTPSGAGTITKSYGISYLEKTGSSAELITAAVDRNFTGGSSHWTNDTFDTFNDTTGLSLVSSTTQYCHLPSMHLNNGAGLSFGKRYSFKYDASNVTGDIYLASVAQATKLLKFFNGNGQYGEFTWLEDNANQGLYIFSYGAASINLDNLSIVEIGGGISPQNFLGGLLSVRTISFTVDGDTSLYTVPAGKRCILHYAVIVAAADAGTTTVSIGAAGSTTDFVGAQTLSNLDTQYDAVIIMPVPNATPVKTKSYAAGTVITATVGAHAGTSASNTIYTYGTCY